MTLRSRRLAVLSLVTLAGCARSGGAGGELTFTENQYRQACQDMRESGKPNRDHINYLTYTPQTAEQDGVFAVGVFNPLAAAQMRCGSVVFDAEGRPEATAVPDLSELKRENDHTFQIMVTGYTPAPEAGDPATVTVFLRNDSGDRQVYPSTSHHAVVPVDPSCQGDGCGHVYNKFVIVQLNAVDAPLFTQGKRGLVEVNWRGQRQTYAFDVPSR